MSELLVGIVGRVTVAEPEAREVGSGVDGGIGRGIDGGGEGDGFCRGGGGIPGGKTIGHSHRSGGGGGRGGGVAEGVAEETVGLGAEVPVLDGLLCLLSGGGTLVHVFPVVGVRGGGVGGVGAPVDSEVGHHGLVAGVVIASGRVVLVAPDLEGLVACQHVLESRDSTGDCLLVMHPAAEADNLLLLRLRRGVGFHGVAAGAGGKEGEGQESSYDMTLLLGHCSFIFSH